MISLILGEPVDTSMTGEAIMRNQLAISSAFAPPDVGGKPGPKPKGDFGALNIAQRSATELQNAEAQS
jgi:hypothetical protein